jgi:polar amino acid transport system substrate-binding protein
MVPVAIIANLMKRSIVTKLKFLAVVIFVFLSIASIQAETEVTMGVVVFPPDVILDEKTNECLGSNITITRELLLEFGIKFHVVCAPPQRIIRLLQSGEIDFTISIKSVEAINKHVVYSDIPIRKIRLNLYSHNESNNSQTISAVRGFEYQGYRKKFSEQGLEFIDLPNIDSAIRVFLKGRSEAMISYESPVQNYMDTNNIARLDTYSITPLLEIDAYYSVAKRSPHRKELIQAFRGYAVKHKAQNFVSAWQQSTSVK